MSTKQQRKKTRAVLTFILVNELMENEKKKRMWIKEWRNKRQTRSDTILLKELRLNAKDDYKNYLRMNENVFNDLLEKIKPHIERQNTHMRECISVDERLSTTLRFLATGRSYSDLQFSTYISKATISSMIIEVCISIIASLKDYIHLPKTEEEWKTIATEFDLLWNFPHCIGAIDGKHINITKPLNSGSYYFNYKKTHSIVLMALVNAKYEFLMVDVGANGRVSDGGIFSNTKFFRSYEENELNLPCPQKVDGFDTELPFVFVADDAFPLQENFIKPYSRHSLTEAELNFNYRLSRARRVVENAFGIIATRFRILLTTINLSPEKTSIIVLAICYLHNYLRKKNPHYIDSREFDNMTTFIELQKNKNSNNTNLAKNSRNNFCQYFNSVG